MRDAGTVSRQMRLSAFSMNCVGHQSQGLWRHPRDRSTEYTSIELWVELARILERGCFDAFFLADVLGIYDVYGGSADAALRNAAQVPVNDPMLVVPVMAAVTEHLGFGITAITSFEPPYTFARRMSTLDHLTRGRVSWNIVTGYLDSAARAMGRGEQTGHDERYEEAEEYLEVVYRLWEGSWEDDAVVRDRIAGVYADPAKVHRVAHDGRRYHVDAIHLAEPSPQRTPVLFQAGSSPRGQRFAARHAECIFVAGNDRAATASTVKGLREEIAAAGRDPDGVLVYSMVSIVVDETTAAARQKADEYAQWASPEGALALLSGWSGLDYARPLDGQTGTGAIEGAARSRPRRRRRGGPSRRAGRVLSTRRRRARLMSPTGSRSGSTRPASTGSTSPARSFPRPTPTSSTTSYPSSNGAGSTAATTPRARCARSSPAAPPGCAPRTRRPATATHGTGDARSRARPPRSRQVEAGRGRRRRRTSGVHRGVGRRVGDEGRLLADRRRDQPAGRGRCEHEAAHDRRVPRLRDRCADLRHCAAPGTRRARLRDRRGDRPGHDRHRRLAARAVAAVDTWHGAAAGIAYLTLAATPLLAGRTLRERGHRRLAALSGLVGVVTATSLALSLTGLPTGLFQRIGLTAGDLWIMVSAIAIIVRRPGQVSSRRPV